MIIWLIPSYCTPSLQEAKQQLKQGSDLEAGTDAETWEKWRLVASSTWFPYPEFYGTQGHHARVASTQLGEPMLPQFLI